jgi:hypothetical protein
LPLIFITNEADEDWWRLEGADEDEADHNKKRKIGPRVEMTREVIEAGGSSYIQLSAELFLAEANQYLNFNVTAGVIEQVRHVVRSKKDGHCMFHTYLRELLTHDEMAFLHKLWPTHSGKVSWFALKDHISYLLLHSNLTHAMLYDTIAPNATITPLAKRELQRAIKQAITDNNSNIPKKTT